MCLLGRSLNKIVKKCLTSCYFLVEGKMIAALTAHRVLLQADSFPPHIDSLFA